MFNVNKKFERIKKLVLIVFRTLEKFQKIIGVASIIFLILSISLFTYKIFYVDESYMKIPDDLHKAVVEKIDNKENIKENEVNKILQKYKNNIEFVSIYKKLENNNELEQVYPVNFDIKKVNKYCNENSYLTELVIPDNSSELSYEVRFGLNYSAFKVINFKIIIGCLIIYWTLFGIWASINCYKKGKLNLFWTSSFFALNIIAYLGFISLSKKKHI